MKIFEERDGYIKFEADKNVNLSSFVLIKAPEKNYIAQVTQLKTAGEKPVAYGKLLFIYNGSLLNYDNTHPPINSEIEIFTSEILNNSFYSEVPIIVGKTLGENLNINIDVSSFNKKMLVNVDDKTENNIITKNLTKQFLNLHKKTIIIDTLGVINAPKLVAGKDFKLPLNKQTLSFLYQDCLTDATSDSKSTIIEIFRDLAEYSDTVSFLPFSTLKTIVEDMVDKSHVFKLLVLKNKLTKFDNLGYFANNKQEVEKLDSILNSNFIILDLSQLDITFQNQYLTYIYDRIISLGMQPQVLLELSNTVTKKTLKKILDTESIATAFITHSKFKYLNDIKNLFDNFIIVPSISNCGIFNLFSSFLKAMPKSSYLIVGEETNYIPLVSNLVDINEFLEYKNESVTKDACIDTKDEKSIEATEQQELAEEQAVISENEETEIIDNTSDTNKQDAAAEEEAVAAEEEDNDEDDKLPSQENAAEPATEKILANIEEKSNQVIENTIAESTELSVEGNIFDTQEEENDTENFSDIQNTVQPDLPDEDIEEVVTISEEDLVDNNTTEVIIEAEPKNISDSAIIVQEDDSETEAIEYSDNVELKDSESEKKQDIENISDESILEELSNTESCDNSIELDSITEEDNNTDFLIADDAENESNDLFFDDTTTEEILISDEIELDLELESTEDINSDTNQSQQASALEQSFENFSNNVKFLPLDNDDENLGEITELDPNEATEDDIIIEMDEDIDNNIEDLDEQIIRDVDKVFTTQKEDTISDSDLDFIDELNSDDGVILEELEDSDLDEITEDYNEGVLNPSAQKSESASKNNEILEKKQSTTPFVPVYDADIPAEDLVVSDPIQQGDIVNHAKYGSGIVEKMIKYGNKTLYSINFDNIGRRLLDPTLTEIKRA